MGAAAAALDDAPPPPELKMAFSLQRWGAVNIMDENARNVKTMTAALNVYQACAAYRSATNSVEWTKRNPDSWRLVSWIIAERRGLKHG